MGRWLYEATGDLIPPNSSKTIVWYFDGFLRVRVLSGDTVLFEPLDEEVKEMSVSSLEPAKDAIPLGPMYGTEGSSRSSLIVCRGSKRLELPATKIGIAVTNATRLL